MSVVLTEAPKKDNTCFICGNPAAFKVLHRGLVVEGEPYDIEYCEACALARTYPFLDAGKLKEIYSSAVYREDDSTRFFSPIEKVIKVIRVWRCKDVEALSKKGAILDVGCGRGDFPALMAERGWRATGIELDKRVETRGKGVNGLTLKSGSLDDITFPDASFDAVTFWHVFEHLKNPGWAVGECRRILKDGGLLVIAVPNAGSLQASLTGRHWFHLDPPFHLYHYSLKSLETILIKNGFEVVKVKHFSFEYNPYGYIQSIFNALGFRNNLLYDFLRSRTDKKASTYLSLAITGLLMPVVLPLSLILSVAEAALGKGGTIEVYAKKK